MGDEGAGGQFEQFAGQVRRSRLVTMTESGRQVWLVEAQPKIYNYYDQVLAGFSVNDVTHTLHYLLKLLDNMQQVDEAPGEDGEGEA